MYYRHSEIECPAFWTKHRISGNLLARSDERMLRVAAILARDLGVARLHYRQCQRGGQVADVRAATVGLFRLEREGTQVGARLRHSHWLNRHPRGRWAFPVSSVRLRASRVRTGLAGP